jgi:hypothetical protein
MANWIKEFGLLLASLLGTGHDAEGVEIVDYH